MIKLYAQEKSLNSALSRVYKQIFLLNEKQAELEAKSDAAGIKYAKESAYIQVKLNTLKQEAEAIETAKSCIKLFC